MRNLLFASALALTFPAYPQQVEKFNLFLDPPTLNTDRGDGYQYEMRGRVLQNDASVGRYLLRVRYSKPDGLIATFAVTLENRSTIVWESYSKYEIDEKGIPLSFAYEGFQISGGKVLAEYTPSFEDKFGGKLVIYFLSN